jgi:uncharacterized protein YndB with AHSA1/START domain
MSAKPSLTIKRRIGVAPHRVYQAWTDATELARWFGPEGADVLRAQADARTGGRYRIVFRTPDGEEHDVSGSYREVIRNEKLVFTWMWRTMPERESVVTVTFERDGDGTLLTLLHEQFFDEGARDRHRSGWTGALDKLEKHFA